MAEERTGEKIFPPFPQTIEEAHSRGHIAKSVYLSTAILIFITGLYFKFFGGGLVINLTNTIKKYVSDIYTVQEYEDIFYSIKVLFRAFNSVLAFLLVVLGVAILISIIQSGFVFSLVPLEPNVERLNPLSGIERIFSRRNFVRLGIGVLVIMIVLGTIFAIIYNKMGSFLNLARTDFYTMISFLGNLCVNIILIIGVVLIILGILDYIYQRAEYIRDLYLTKSEYLQELKRFEGDPRIKEQWRRLHRELVRQAGLKEVPKATVVVTNPTHIAVALEYKIYMLAPKVIAKGKGLIALKIREIALKHNIPVVERPQAARLLYKLNVGQYVPKDLYLIVVEILRYVYMIRPQLLGVTK